MTTSQKIHNLLFGAASLVSIFPASRKRKHRKLYNPAKSAQEALRQDWKRLGLDMSKAIDQVVHDQR